METAGRAVVFSGVTVAIGLFALIALPLPFLRSMGYGGMLIPLVSTIVAITLLPVTLAKVGRRLDWPHRRTDDKASRAWTRWGQAVARRRWVAAGAGMAVMLALVLAATDLQLGDRRRQHGCQVGRRRGGADGARARRHRRGLDAAARDPGRRSDRSRPLAADLRRVDGIHAAVAPSGPEWNRDGSEIVEAVPVADSGSDEGDATLKAVRDVAHAAGPAVRVGGGQPPPRTSSTPSTAASR